MKPNIRPMRLWKMPHVFGSGCEAHSAHDERFPSLQHVRILHQDALVFSMHPGHFPRFKDPHAPQYRPQEAMRSELPLISSDTDFPFYAQLSMLSQELTS